MQNMLPRPHDATTTTAATESDWVSSPAAHAVDACTATDHHTEIDTDTDIDTRTDVDTDADVDTFTETDIETELDAATDTALDEHIDAATETELDADLDTDSDGNENTTTTDIASTACGDDAAIDAAIAAIVIDDVAGGHRAACERVDRTEEARSWCVSTRPHPHEQTNSPSIAAHCHRHLTNQH